MVGGTVAANQHRYILPLYGGPGALISEMPVIGRTEPPSGPLGEPVPLVGGRGTAWRAGDAVLKPLDMSVEALRWQADVLSSVRCDGFRVAAPLSSDEGELVVDGWTAWPALAGAHAERWSDIVAVGERFEGGELLIRALLFRLLSERDPAAATATYRPAVEHACG